MLPAITTGRGVSNHHRHQSPRVMIEVAIVLCVALAMMKVRLCLIAEASQQPADAITGALAITMTTEEGEETVEQCVVLLAAGGHKKAPAASEWMSQGLPSRG